MAINTPYKSAAELPDIVPVFPLAGALLLPRGELPLTIFEPRYLAMVDDALRGPRLIGMIQPADPAQADDARPPLAPVGCLGRMTQIAETGNGRYVISLSGVARFRVREELRVTTPYRQCRLDLADFAADFVPRKGEAAVDREAVLRTLRDFAEANSLQVDWKSVESAPNEALVNALSMMGPFGPKEKQALLEAETLSRRAEVLVAITEMELARTATTQTLLQ